MFEEVPRERRGIVRLLPVRRVVLGPFVLGGGMLLAALGGSVAVAAAAATMITASAIGSDEAPARPGHSGASPAASSKQAVSAKQSPARHRSVAPLPTGQSPAPLRTGAPSRPAVAGVPGSTAAPEVATPTQTRTLALAAPSRSAGPTALPPGTLSTSSATPAPSSGAPLGNAMIRVSGYDPASQRLAYQFASVQPGADGIDLYQVSGPETFNAALAPSVTITSGGSLCPPAGSACSVDQLIQAADSGFFAIAAIDVRGEIRSLIEVGNQSAAPKTIPTPSTEAAVDGNVEVRSGSAAPAPVPSSSSGS